MWIGVYHHAGDRPRAEPAPSIGRASHRPRARWQPALARHSSARREPLNGSHERGPLRSARQHVGRGVVVASGRYANDTAITALNGDGGRCRRPVHRTHVCATKRTRPKTGSLRHGTTRRWLKRSAEQEGRRRGLTGVSRAATGHLRTGQSAEWDHHSSSRVRRSPLAGRSPRPPPLPPKPPLEKPPPPPPPPPP